MTSLLRYDAACRAVAEAVTVDDVQELLSKADGLRVYARQAKDVQLENNAKLIRWRAIKRLGEMLAEKPKAKGTRGTINGKDESGGVILIPPEDDVPSLNDIGVDKNLAKIARRYAEMEDNSFERLIARCQVHAESERLPLDVLAAEAREHRQSEAREAYEARVAEGCRISDLETLISEGKTFAAIYADPPWHFEVYSEEGEDRSPDYDTKGLDAIKALPVAALAAPDSVLFVWVLMNQLPQALELITAWGFTFKTCAFTWIKQNKKATGFFMGMGYWTRANAELCLLATRGNPKRVEKSVKQVHVSPLMDHSRKPDEFRTRIERLVDGPYLELYARREAEGWTTWGNEIPRDKFFGPHDADTGEVVEGTG